MCETLRVTEVLDATVRGVNRLIIELGGTPLIIERPQKPFDIVPCMVVYIPAVSGFYVIPLIHHQLNRSNANVYVNIVR